MDDVDLSRLMKAALQLQQTQVDTSIILEALIQLLVQHNVVESDALKLKCSALYERMNDDLESALSNLDMEESEEPTKSGKIENRTPIFKAPRGEA